ncbi:methyl-accepting chemotaxis protein [Paracidovorax avenae]|nr:methyl-accepting chemotaxis protein [Paracidovorax avenae]AVS99652.1 methyl-accepting chemotaxis protein [Paracidovorax avenae]AVT06707.1 methyl-accepting chemotaxis protein [Paracidovorax avenae]AVT21073.1 methyl-accepting chemotaxis protein [Paracidovorax avenae]
MADVPSITKSFKNMTHWIGNLKFSSKFVLIGCIAFAMFLLPTVLLMRTTLADVQTALQERRGLAPARELLKLLQLTQQHRGLSASMLGGTESAAAPRQAKQAEVEASLGRAKQALAGLGDNTLGQRLDSIQGDWNTLASGVAGKTLRGADSNRLHVALIERMLGLIDDVANSSGLARDTDIRTHYLQKAVLGQLPQLTESLGQMRARGALVLARGEVAPEERARIEALSDRVRKYYGDARKALELAAGGSLPPAVEKARDAALAAAQEGFKLADDNIVKADVLSMPSTDWVARMTRIIDTQFELVAASFDVLEQSLDDQIAQMRQNMVVLGVVLAVLAAAALWIMAMVTRATTRSIGEAVRIAEAVADGDLTAQVEPQGRDEVARLLHALAAMTRKLGTVVGTVRLNAENVASASVQIAQGNTDLSQRTESQASSLEETAASMEELGSTVRQNADNARQADQLARSAAGVAAQGGTVVQQVVETMRGIHTSSARIGDIIGVIDGIAFQTNILALNAAVEAARAGEQGRGFAVVAGEVRSLAQRSASAAKEIKELITASVAQVQSGTALVDQAGTTMTEIVDSIRKVSDIVGEITSATVEQSEGVAQVGEAVSQMDNATQQNAALVEESAAAASSLKSQAQQLVDTVAMFRLNAGA